MSFGFGQSTFGSKPTGFGAPFGATTTTSSTFTGGFGSTTFGTPAPSTSSAFGSTFGTPTASAAPVFGSTFGTAGPSTASTFGTPGQTAGSAFGTPTPNVASAFGVPGPSTAPTFGAPGPSTASAFGSTFQTPTSTPAFGSTFGATATSAPTFGNTFGAPVASAPSLFGTPAAKPSLFGTPSTTSNLFSTPASTASIFGTTTQAPSLFGTQNLFSTTSTPSLFGAGNTFGVTTTSAPTFTSGLFGTTPAFGSSNVGSGMFGTITTSAPSLFGGFAPQNTTGNFGTFGGANTFGMATTTTTPSNFGYNLTSQRPIVSIPGFSQMDIKTQQFYASINLVNLFPDEKDNYAIKKLNYLQACFGSGKGYYNPTLPPFEYDFTNPYCLFKAISYVVIPQQDNAEGLVKVHFNRKESELSPQKEVLLNGFAGMLGNKPNLTVEIKHIKAISESDAEIMICVSERGVTGTSRKIYATDLSNFLNQPMQKQQLTNVGVTYIGPYMAPTRAQLDEYLRIPPAGITKEMWDAAQIDNPNPQKFLPAPVYGFPDLQKRLVCQRYESGLHRAFLEKAYNQIMEVRRKNVNTVAKLADQKQTLMELQHRVIKIITKQESIRKTGMAMQPEEEAIRAKLEYVKTQLSNSTQFRGRLHELMNTITLREKLQQGGPSRQPEYRIDPTAKEDIREVLEMQQQGIKEVVKIINKDLKDLKIIQDGLNETLNSNNK